jgi:hypothetical protein
MAALIANHLRGRNLRNLLLYRIQPPIHYITIDRAKRNCMEGDYLKVTKCEIFDRLDSRVFYITNPIWEGLGPGIFRFFFHVWGRYGPFY